VNDPHTQGIAGDKQNKGREPMLADGDFYTFLKEAYKVWRSGDTNPEKGNEIRRLVLIALANKDESNGEKEDHNAPHTQGIEDARLESDAMALFGATPRKTNRKARAVAAKRSEEQDIMEAIKRRDARNLIGYYPTGYHQ
jgi:hypothetical protein